MRPNRSISYGELKEAFGRDALLYESITDILIYLEQIIEIRINVDDRSDDCDYFQYFHHCKRLKRFFLVDENQSFSVKDGVLYSKDGKELLWFPQNKDIRHFEVPQVVEQIAWLESNKVKSLVLPDSLIDMRIFNCQNLTTIALGKNCRIPSNPPHFCQECPNLLNVKVNPKHPTLTAKDGVLFDKNLSRIIRYPTKKSHSGAYITPPGVTRIANFAFADAKFSYFSYSDDITGVPLHDFFSGYKYLQEHQMVVGVIDFNHHIKTIHFGSSSSDIKPCYLKNLHVSTIEVAEINPKYKAIDERRQNDAFGNSRGHISEKRWPLGQSRSGANRLFIRRLHQAHQ